MIGGYISDITYFSIFQVSQTKADKLLVKFEQLSLIKNIVYVKQILFSTFLRTRWPLSGNLQALG